MRGKLIGLAFVLALSGCSTMEKAAWIGLGGSAPLTVVETQRSFARFVPVGQNSAKLRTELTLRETPEPLGVNVRLCSPDDPASVGLEVEPSDYGVALSLMAGRKGEFIPNGEYSNCKTDQGIRTCARMKMSLEVSLCFNPGWQEDLKTKGEGVEVVPARVDLSWSCAGMGNCSWAHEGKPLADARFILKKVPHRDEAVAAAYQEATRWKKAGFNDSTAKRWADAGFASGEASEWGEGIRPEEAAQWKGAGWSVAEAKAWRAKASSLDDAFKWRKSGFTLEDYAAWNGVKVYMNAGIAAAWRNAGYAPKAAAGWIGSGIENPADAKALGKMCPKGLEPFEALYQSNPYDVKGRCFAFVGTTRQILSRSSGLYLLGGEQPALVGFGSKSAPPHVFRGITKGVGAYKYVAVSGSEKIVPSLEAVLVQESQ